MFFNLGKLLKYGSLLFFILILALSVRNNLKAKYQITAREINPVVKADSTLVNKGETLTQISDRKAEVYDNKSGSESHSSLNSVNLIIYMIYQVTNKSLR